MAEEWQEEGAITQILVARRLPMGQIAIGTFLVDLGCLGVKSAFGRLFNTRREYEELRNGMMAHQDMIKANISLVAKIIHEAISYAQDLVGGPEQTRWWRWMERGTSRLSAPLYWMRFEAPGELEKWNYH